MLIVADSAVPFLRGVFEPFGVEVEYREVIGREDVLRADAIVVRTRTRCDESLLGGSRVRLVASATAGLDHVDLDFCLRAGIDVVSAAGSNAGAVLQWVAAALVFCGREPGVVGVVGVGHVGSLVAEYARGWGFEVLCCDPPRGCEGFVALDEIARRCDIITFHTPLTHAGEYPTYHLAGERFFSVLKPGAVIFNSSRGEVVDTRAMMRSGCDCCIDVWEGEPRPEAEVIDRALLATPHIAGYSIQGKANATAAAVRAVARKFGLPLADWYPAEVAQVVPRNIGWEELCRTIGSYFDIAATSRALKSSPEAFERLRTAYPFRQEYF